MSVPGGLSRAKISLGWKARETETTYAHSLIEKGISYSLCKVRALSSLLDVPRYKMSCVRVFSFL